MPTEEFKSKCAEFWYTLGKILATVPLLLVIGCTVAYYIGTFRQQKIKMYNDKATIWQKTGISEFKNLSFNLTDSTGVNGLRMRDTTTGEYYPVRDSCKMKKDPKKGCVYTDALYYSKHVIVVPKDNHYILEGPSGNVIFNKKLDSNATYVKTPKDLGCRSNTENCPILCDEVGGKWNPIKEECAVTVYVDGICIRVVKDHNNWVPDVHNVGKLPQNKHYELLESDGIGCDYGNNWNSAHYGKTQKSDIIFEVRSAADSYIAASAYTESCSNDYFSDNNCFGPTQRVERYGAFLAIHIAFGLVALEIIVIIVVVIAAKLKHKRAVRAAQQETGNADLIQTV